MMEKLKSAVKHINLPRLIIILFFLFIVLLAYVNDINVNSYIGSTIKYWGMWGVLVLAMVPSIKCGIGPNFGISLGIVCGLLGSLLAIEFGITDIFNGIVPGLGPWAAIAFAMISSAFFAWFV